MASFNRVILLGNLTRDVEIKYTPGGTAVAEIGLAVNRKWKDNAGQQKEEVTFVDVTLWGRTAEVAGEYLHKGSPALIEGYLKLDTWDDKNGGGKRYKLRVVGEHLQLLGSGNSSTARQGSVDQSRGQSTAGEGSQVYEDDVPF